MPVLLRVGARHVQRPSSIVASQCTVGPHWSVGCWGSAWRHFCDVSTFPSGPARFTFRGKVTEAQRGRWHDSGLEGGIPVPVGRRVLLGELAQVTSSPAVLT